MSYGPIQRGFTIIETLIFLTVSASVFGVAITQYTAQEHEGQFTQGVRDLQSQLQLYQNEVASTYASNIASSGFQCLAVANNAQPTFPPGGPTADNSGCIFLGRAIGFGNTAYCSVTDSNMCGRYTSVPIVARRLFYPTGPITGNPVSTLAEAKPVGLSSCTSTLPLLTGLTCGYSVLPLLSTRPNLAETGIFKNNIGVYKAFVRNADGSAKTVVLKNESGAISGTSADIGAIAYVLSLNGSGSEATPIVNLMWLPISFVGNTEWKVTHSIDNLGTSSPAEEASYTNPPYGVALCLYGAYGQPSELVLGTNNNPSDVQIQPSNHLDSGC